jgi:YbbR domain-containing protein
VPKVEDPLGETRFSGVAVYPVDADGKRIFAVATDPPFLSGVLRYRRPIVELSVRVDIRGRLADGYVLDGWEVQPQWVRLDGARDVLQNMSFVSTQPVDYTGFTEDRAVPVKLRLPKGVRAINAAEGVTVTVKVVAPGSRTFDVPVVAQNVRSDLVATVTPGQVRVLLSGTQSDLEKLSAADVKAYGDLSGRGPGRYRVALRIVPPTGAQMRSVTPEEADVELRAPGADASAVPRPTP